MNRTEGPPERLLSGIAISPGVAVGPVFDTTEAMVVPVRRKIAADAVAGETARLEEAAAASRKQVVKLKARLAVLPEEAQEELSPLLDAYIQMLGNSRLMRQARRRIAEGLVSAETAVTEEAEAIGDSIMELGGDDRAGLKRRADEVREIARRLTRNLTRAPFKSFANLPDGAILVTEALTPADAALLDPTRIAAVAAEEGGADGHTAIMLRALGIPAVLGVPGLTDAAQPGMTAAVDGAAGTVVLEPGRATLAEAKRGIAAFAREKQRLGRLRRLPAETTDGESIELAANLEIPQELPLIAQSGARGIGLFRSEFLFMNRETLPDEDAQAEAYADAIEAMDGDCVTIRVLDWGGEKEIEALSAEGVVPVVADANPALGLRGIRLLLRRPALFETQLAAIIRAANLGPVRILLPMVTVPEEVRTAREVMDRVVRRLRRRGAPVPEKLPPLGVMIETPGAALGADALALEADFFAIGTNDLAMYTLAVDRADSELATLYDPMHPAVLRLVQFATEAALRLRMPVSVCGEMAGNPVLTPLLIGLGVRSFSMNASAVPRVKQVIRSTTVDDCARLARQVMQQSDAKLIREMVTGFGRKADG